MLLQGKEFEELCLFRARAEEKLGTLTMNRYGVQGTFKDGAWMPIDSYPDFEGVTPDGLQFIFDTKVCTKPSFPLDKTSSLFKLQYRHMIRRSKFNVATFILLYFNARKLKTKFEEEQTVAIPVRPDFPLWEEFDRGERKHISRTEAQLYGIVVPWNTYSDQAIKDTPDLLLAITEVRKQCRKGL